MLLFSSSTSLPGLGADALVVVVDGDREDLLRLLLADDVLAELLVDELGRRDALERRLRLDLRSRSPPG